jgi:hypothetical protein
VDRYRLHNAILERVKFLQQEADTAHLNELRGTPAHNEEGPYVLVEYP